MPYNKTKAKQIKLNHCILKIKHEAVRKVQCAYLNPLYQLQTDSITSASTNIICIMPTLVALKQSGVVHMLSTLPWIWNIIFPPKSYQISLDLELFLQTNNIISIYEDMSYYKQNHT